MGGVLMTHGGPSDTEGVPMAHGVHPSVTMWVLVAHGVPMVYDGTGGVLVTHGGQSGTLGSIPVSPGGSRCHMRVLMAYDGMGGGSQ